MLTLRVNKWMNDYEFLIVNTIVYFTNQNSSISGTLTLHD